MQAVSDQLPRLGKRELIRLLVCGFCSERFPLPLGAWDGLRYFILFYSLGLPYIYFSDIRPRLFSSNAENCHIVKGK